MMLYVYIIYIYICMYIYMSLVIPTLGFQGSIKFPCASFLLYLFVPCSCNHILGLSCPVKMHQVDERSTALALEWIFGTVIPIA